MARNHKDLGGKLILEAFFTNATIYLDLYVGPATQADTDGMLTHELCDGPDTYEVDISANISAVDLNGDGIPRITWTSETWTFTGALTNVSGHLAVIGYRITALFPGLSAPYDDTIVLWDELLPDGGITPGVGNKLTIYPECLLGKGTPA